MEWSYQIDLFVEHLAYEAGILTPRHLAEVVASKIEYSDVYHTVHRGVLEPIVVMLRSDVRTLDQYTLILHKLYNWADTPLKYEKVKSDNIDPDDQDIQRRLCWIRTTK